VSTPDKELKAIAYRMDALIPGFYAWFGSLRIRIGGSEAEETYPGTIYSFAGVALVLPGYRIFSTYQESMAFDKHTLQGNLNSLSTASRCKDYHVEVAANIAGAEAELTITKQYGENSRILTER
jgi:hypothetical protein